MLILAGLQEIQGSFSERAEGPEGPRGVSGGAWTALEGGGVSTLTSNSRRSRR